MNNWKDKVKINSYRWDLDLFAKKELPYDLSPPQSKVLNNLKYKEEDKVIISAAGGSGKTLGMGVFALWACTILSEYLGKPIEVQILGGSGKQSRILYQYVEKFIDMNKWIQQFVDGEPKKRLTEFKNGSRITAAKASQTSVRGIHGDIHIIDEAVEVKKPLIDAVLTRVSPTKFPKRILCSTPHDYDSYFVEIWENHEDWGYSRYQWSKTDLIDMNFVDVNEVENAKNVYDNATYKQEYLGQPVPVTGTIIDRDDLKSSIVRKNQVKEDFELFSTMGIDWGSGGQNHPTAYVISQRNKNYVEVIDSGIYTQQKFKWIHNRFGEYYNRYEVDIVYADAEDKGENQRLRQEQNMFCKEIAFTKQNKNKMISNMRRFFEFGRILIPDTNKELIRQLKKYTKGTSAKDDLVDALMLSLYAHDKNKSDSVMQSGVMYAKS